MNVVETLHEVIDVPFVLRGQVVSDYEVEHRAGALAFRTPDPGRYLSQLPLAARAGMDDLHQITIDEIIEFLAELGRRLGLEANPHLRRAFDIALASSNLTEPVLREIYENQLSRFFDPDRIREAVETRLGRDYLEGWVHEPNRDGRALAVRAFGSRATHLVAGNSPGVSAQTIVRNAITRSDAIIKTPSNDPVTAVAILQTMVDMDAQHPVTRHASALHWRGGDARVEQVVFSPPNIDKIVAWGGVSAIQHVAKYVGPGIELISLDPKISISILGREVLEDDEVQADAARRLAIDVGTLNQEACVNARVAYVDTDGVADASSAVRRLAERFFTELQALPPAASSAADHLPPDLRDELESALLFGEPEVVGGGTTSGGALISWTGEPVDYTAALAARYLNLVPVAGFNGVLESISSVTQTCGVFPVALQDSLRDRLALAGVQRVATLGRAAGGGDNQTIPQDGIEVLRRMCRWMVEERDPVR